MSQGPERGQAWFGHNGGVTAFQPGDRVHVAGFGKGLVREVRNRGRYRVEIKGQAMEVTESQLSPLHASGTSADAADGRRGDQSTERGAPPSSPASTGVSSNAIVTLDLHGHTVEEALAALDQSLNDALLAGASQLHVIHGRSGGRIKAAVHRRLGEISSVRTFSVDPRNEGVTIVSL